MINIEICSKCREENGIPKLDKGWESNGWYCPGAKGHRNIVSRDEDPPEGCRKLFEQAVSMTKKS